MADQGGRIRNRLVESAWSHLNAGERVNAAKKIGFHPLADPASQCDDRKAARLGAPRNLGRHLAKRRLPVKAALGGKHEIGLGQQGIEIGVMHDHVESRTQHCTEKRMQPRADAA
jgi:hypothetical protein